METSHWPGWHCPVHKKPLAREEALVCPEGETFPLVAGIPRFVPRTNYADAFGAQWKRYKLTQLDSFTRLPITADRARRCLGEELWHNLSSKQVLECGCGAGRFTEILLERGSRVTSIDLSEAVDANQDNFPQNEQHRVAQADIGRLPFASQQFDVVLCLGVIQHTPNPEETIANLYEHVKPGGYLVIDHYTHALSWYTKAAPLFRRVFRRLSASKGMRWSERLVSVLLPIHKATRRVMLARVILSRVSPVLSYYHVYPDLGDELQREWALLDTHDSLTDWYRHVRSRRQIEATFNRLGLTNIGCKYGGIGVECRGMRPLPA